MTSQLEARQPTLAQLRAAGFALAHALASVDGGDPLCTLAFVERDDGANLVRYEAPSIQESIVVARRDLHERLREGGHAALVYDGFVTNDRARSDALIVEVIDARGDVVAVLTQAYRPARPGPLALLRLVGLRGPGGVSVIGQPTTSAPMPPGGSEALEGGLAEHPFGRRVFGLRRRPPIG